MYTSSSLGVSHRRPTTPSRSSVGSGSVSVSVSAAQQSGRHTTMATTVKNTMNNTHAASTIADSRRDAALAHHVVLRTRELLGLGIQQFELQQQQLRRGAAHSTLSSSSSSLPPILTMAGTLDSATMNALCVKTASEFIRSYASSSSLHIPLTAKESEGLLHVLAKNLTSLVARRSVAEGQHEAAYQQQQQQQSTVLTDSYDYDEGGNTNNAPSSSSFVCSAEVPPLHDAIGDVSPPKRTPLPAETPNVHYASTIMSTAAAANHNHHRQSAPSATAAVGSAARGNARGGGGSDHSRVTTTVDLSLEAFSPIAATVAAGTVGAPANATISNGGAHTPRTAAAAAPAATAAFLTVPAAKQKGAAVVKTILDPFYADRHLSSEQYSRIVATAVEVYFKYNPQALKCLMPSQHQQQRTSVVNSGTHHSVTTTAVVGASTTTTITTNAAPRTTPSSLAARHSSNTTTATNNNSSSSSNSNKALSNALLLPNKYYEDPKHYPNATVFSTLENTALSPTNLKNAVSRLAAVAASTTSAHATTAANNTNATTGTASASGGGGGGAEAQPLSYNKGPSMIGAISRFDRDVPALSNVKSAHGLNPTSPREGRGRWAGGAVGSNATAHHQQQSTTISEEFASVVATQQRQSAILTSSLTLSDEEALAQLATHFLKLELEGINCTDAQIAAITERIMTERRRDIATSNSRAISVPNSAGTSRRPTPTNQQRRASRAVAATTADGGFAPPVTAAHSAAAATTAAANAVSSNNVSIYNDSTRSLPNRSPFRVGAADPSLLAFSSVGAGDRGLGTKSNDCSSAVVASAVLGGGGELLDGPNGRELSPRKALAVSTRNVGGGGHRHMSSPLLRGASSAVSVFVSVGADASSSAASVGNNKVQQQLQQQYYYDVAGKSSVATATATAMLRNGANSPNRGRGSTPLSGAEAVVSDYTAVGGGDDGSGNNNGTAAAVMSSSIRQTNIHIVPLGRSQSRGGGGGADDAFDNNDADHYRGSSSSIVASQVMSSSSSSHHRHQQNQSMRSSGANSPFVRTAAATTVGAETAEGYAHGDQSTNLHVSNADEVRRLRQQLQQQEDEAQRMARVIGELQQSNAQHSVMAAYKQQQHVVRSSLQSSQDAFLQRMYKSALAGNNHDDANGASGAAAAAAGGSAGLGATNPLLQRCSAGASSLSHRHPEGPFEREYGKLRAALGLLDYAVDYGADEEGAEEGYAGHDTHRSSTCASAPSAIATRRARLIAALDALASDDDADDGGNDAQHTGATNAMWRARGDDEEWLRNAKAQLLLAQMDAADEAEIEADVHAQLAAARNNATVNVNTTVVDGGNEECPNNESPARSRGRRDEEEDEGGLSPNGYEEGVNESPARSRGRYAPEEEDAKSPNGDEEGNNESPARSRARGYQPVDEEEEGPAGGEAGVNESPARDRSRSHVGIDYDTYDNSEEVVNNESPARSRGRRDEEEGEDEGGLSPNGYEEGVNESPARSRGRYTPEEEVRSPNGDEDGNNESPARSRGRRDDDEGANCSVPPPEDDPSEYGNNESPARSRVRRDEEAEGGLSPNGYEEGVNESPARSRGRYEPEEHDAKSPNGDEEGNNESPARSRARGYQPVDEEEEGPAGGEAGVNESPARDRSRSHVGIDYDTYDNSEEVVNNESPARSRGRRDEEEGEDEGGLSPNGYEEGVNESPARSRGRYEPEEEVRSPNGDEDGNNESPARSRGRRDDDEGANCSVPPPEDDPSEYGNNESPARSRGRRDEEAEGGLSPNGYEEGVNESPARSRGRYEPEGDEAKSPNGDEEGNNESPARSRARGYQPVDEEEEEGPAGGEAGVNESPARSRSQVGIDYDTYDNSEEVVNNESPARSRGRRDEEAEGGLSPNGYEEGVNESPARSRDRYEPEEEVRSPNGDEDGNNESPARSRGRRDDEEGDGVSGSVNASVYYDPLAATNLNPTAAAGVSELHDTSHHLTLSATRNPTMVNFQPHRSAAADGADTDSAGLLRSPDPRPSSFAAPSPVMAGVMTVTSVESTPIGPPANAKEVIVVTNDNVGLVAAAVSSSSIHSHSPLQQTPSRVLVLSEHEDKRFTELKKKREASLKMTPSRDEEGPEGLREGFSSSSVTE